MTRSIFAALVILCFLALQVFLSLRKNRWLGLILPMIYAFAVLALVFGNPLANSGIILILTIVVYILIPVGINLLIYFACRRRVKEKSESEIEKMNIQDLD
ncbi:MAG TPA: hypothetical protein VJ990_08025 [Clostridia bacterium]|nr:hypothetical protein [Clostridia bacterium]